MSIKKTAKFFGTILTVLLVIAASIYGTLYLSHHYNIQIDLDELLPQTGNSNSAKTQKYNLFDGYDVCVEAIHTALQQPNLDYNSEHISGKIITLYGDDRTARFNSYSNANTLTFVADVTPNNKRFLSEQHSTVKVDIQCSTSVSTNEVVNLKIEPVK